jgi:NAD(P)H-hydrate epimerase
MGDVLTGVIAALLGQGLGAFDAAQVGAWLCGRAGELAIDGGGATEETLTPTVLLDHLDEAFRALRSGDAQGACHLRT